MEQGVEALGVRVNASVEAAIPNGRGLPAGLAEMAPGPELAAVLSR
jgi:hypothetical protein